MEITYLFFAGDDAPPSGHTSAGIGPAVGYHDNTAQAGGGRPRRACNDKKAHGRDAGSFLQSGGILRHDISKN